MLFLLKLESIQVICWWESKPGKVWIIIHGRKGQGMPGHHRKSSGQLVINMSNNMEWAGGVECFIFNRNAFIISFWDKWMPPAGGVECFIFNRNDFIISFWDKWMPPLMDCHLAVVEGLECLRDPANSASRGLASGRCNQAGKINGERPDKRAVKKKLF